MKQNSKQFQKTLQDALRYRFLRSEKSRDHQFNTCRAFTVEICDWARNLGGTVGVWSSLPVAGADMDKAIDAAIRRVQK